MIRYAMKEIHVIAFLALLTMIAANERETPILTKCPYPEKDNKTTTNLAHEIDCTTFYKCDRGRGVLLNCSLMDKYEKLHYNRREQVCDWPWRAGCAQCPGKDKNGNYPRSKISNEEDNCKLYWECIDGEKHLRRCPAGLCFSRTCQDCVTNRRGGNCEFGCNNGDRKPHEYKSNQYYECIDNDWVLQYCEEYHHFDPIIKKCRKIGGCDDGDRKAHKYKSNQYYECIDNDWVLQYCEEYHHFDPIIKKCRKIGGCDDGDRKAHEYKSNQYYECIDNDWVLQYCEENHHFDPIIKKCRRKSGCDDGDRKRHECICYQYYECINNKWILSYCEGDDHFDSRTKKCRNPKVADC